jgi:hypothetical protein
MYIPPGDALIHWFTSQQLPGDLILQHLTHKDAMQLASTCTQLWSVVERLVTLTRPNIKVALAITTPDGLRIPLLTGLTLHDARAYNNAALQGACKNGHLKVAQWLTERFELTADDARAHHNRALLWACQNGHLAVVHWLEEEFGIKRAEVNN